MIVVADAGPLLHLHWVEATTWALPPMAIHVVDAVWSEVHEHDPAALTDPRFMRIASPHPRSALGLEGLDAGEAAAITYALAQREPLIGPVRRTGTSPSAGAGGPSALAAARWAGSRGVDVAPRADTAKEASLAHRPG